MSDAKLKSYAARINAVMDEIKEKREFLQDLYVEAKGHGYIPKVLRKAITRQRMDASKRAEEDSILELYDHALGNIGEALEAISKGATWEDAGKAHGVKRATLARSAAVSKRREVIPDNSEGEIEKREAEPTVSRDGEASADERDASASPSPPISMDGAVSAFAENPADDGLTIPPFLKAPARAHA